MLVVPLAAPVAAVDPVVQDPPVDQVTPEILAQAELDLVTLTNRQRAAYGRGGLRMDPDLMAIARDRAEVMAANELMSHTEPDGRKVWDRLNDAHITWFAGGEILAWNPYPTEYTTAEAIRAWMASPDHHAIMVSTGYNYVGFGAAVSADGNFSSAGVFAKLPDHTGPWARFRTTTMRTVDARHKRVTVHWSGGDTRL